MTDGREEPPPVEAAYFPPELSLELRQHTDGSIAITKNSTTLVLTPAELSRLFAFDTGNTSRDRYLDSQ